MLTTWSSENDGKDISIFFLFLFWQVKIIAGARLVVPNQVVAGREGVGRRFIRFKFKTLRRVLNFKILSNQALDAACYQI